MRANYGTVAMPPVHGHEPNDNQRIMSDRNLGDNLEVTRGVYEQIMFHLQLYSGHSHSEMPSPDGHRYFTKDEFSATFHEEPDFTVSSNADTNLI